MRGRQINVYTRNEAGTLKPPWLTLYIAREGSIYRGVTLFKKLDEFLRNETKLMKFKEGVRE